METILSIGIVTAGGLAYYFFKKQQDKKKGFISAGIAIVLFVLFGVFVVEPGNKQEEIKAEQNQPDVQEVERPNEDEADVIEGEDEEENKNNEVSFDDLISNTHIDSYQIDDETGIVIVQAPVDGVFSGESAVESFNQDMWMTLQEYNELFSDGVFYLGYGDVSGEELYKLAAQFNGETLSQIDFDKVILDSESIIYSDRYYISGFGDLDLDFPTSKEGDPLIEGDPVDELWFNETVGPKRELKSN
jgi:hypothetical protein